jgi:membrane protease YdiL (CAAX protease family)
MGRSGVRVPPELSPLPVEGIPGPGRLGSLAAYVVALLLSVVAITSQYFVPQTVPPLAPFYHTLLGGLGIVYGIPVLAFAVLVGARPLARWWSNSGVAAWEGLRWYALLSLLAFGVIASLLALYSQIDPSAVRLLSKPNPVLQQAASNPWPWVAFSFAIGAIEELIFRGWIFGYWLARGTRRWGVHAAWTSALFAGVHLYYGTIYGAAAPIVYPTLFLLGFSFAAAVRASGGNLWVVAVLHGAHDAGAFLTLVSLPLALVVEYGVIGIGGVIALWDYLARRPPPTPPYPGIPPFALGAFPPPGAPPPPDGAPIGSWPPPAPPVAPAPVPPSGSTSGPR